MTMKAVVQERYGLPEILELREVERPAAGEDEVLVRVRAASVHPDVWHFLSGRPWIMRLIGAGLRRPKVRIPGSDVAGVVEAVGTGVTRFREGDQVFGETNVTDSGWTTGGAYAEYVAVRQDQLAPKPDNVTFEQAASVPTSGYIALSNLRGGARDLAGKRVLINGGGGGVGSLAIQITKAWGAHVTAVDTTSKLDMMRSLGTDQVIDYTREDFTRSGDRYDLIVDIPGNHSFRTCRRVLEPDGRYVLIGHSGYGAAGSRALGIFPRFFGLVFLARFVKQLRGPDVPLPSRNDVITVLHDLLKEGRITPVIDSTYPLGDAPAALRHLMEDETLGKVILTP